MPFTFTRNEDKCTQCAACGADCSPSRFGLIDAPGGIANPADPRCEDCGHCYSLCPRGAIGASVEPVVPPRLTGLDGPSMELGALFELLTMRRSERRFTDRPLREEEIDALLAAAGQFPSGGNARTVMCRLLPDNEERDGVLAAIRRFYHGLHRIAGSPITRKVVGALLGKAAGAFLNDPEYRRRFEALVEAIDGGIDPVFYHAPMVLLFHTDALMPTPEEDAVIAAYNAALAAAAMGLGSCFVSMAQKAIGASRRVRRAIGLPAGQRVLAVLAVGTPEVTRHRPVVRPALPARRSGAAG